MVAGIGLPVTEAILTEKFNLLEPFDALVKIFIGYNDAKRATVLTRKGFALRLEREQALSRYSQRNAARMGPLASRNERNVRGLRKNMFIGK